MAAHSSPRGSTPCVRERARAATRRLDVAELLEPERVGQPPRRVDGEHEHPAAEMDGGHRRRGRGGGGLADAARAAGDDDLLGRQQRLERRRSVDVGSSAVERARPRASATVASRTPWWRVNSSGTYTSGTSPAEARRAGGRGARRRAPAQAHRERRRRRARSSTPGADLRASASSVGGRAAGRTASSSPRPNSSGSTLVDDDRGEVDVRSRRRGGSTSSIVSLTGISSGVVDDDRAGRRRVLQDVEHPLDLLAHDPTCTSSRMASRRGELADDVAGGRRVDDDEVVVVARAPRTRACRR